MPTAVLYHITMACPTKEQRHLCTKLLFHRFGIHPSFHQNGWKYVNKCIIFMDMFTRRWWRAVSKCLQEHLHQKWPSVYCLNCKLVECLWMLADNSWMWTDCMWCSSSDQEADTVLHCWNKKKRIPNIHTYFSLEALPGCVFLHVWLIEGETQTISQKPDFIGDNLQTEIRLHFLNKLCLVQLLIVA